jgi:cysteinyl-tRNA synthetase
MDTLGCLRPTRIPHATAYIEQMVDLIAELDALGVAYETSDGVYFTVADVADYGLLAQQSLASLRSGARVEVNEEKRSPLDFALWKKAKPGEPEWESPFGPGRPGWHTECVVMSLALLGEGFDLHGGGQDLIFPHHENERAQAVALGRRFARHWMHHGMVQAHGGEKMSKSLGNVLLLSTLFEGGTDPRAYRLLVLQSHYRAPTVVTTVTLDDAGAALRRLDALSERLGGAGEPEGSPDDEASAKQAGVAVRSAFAEKMNDDLDTPGATAVVFEAIRRANAALDAREHARGAELARAALECFAAVGLYAAGASEVPDAVLDLGRRRDQARAARDYATADLLRAEIEGLGYVVEDTSAGTRIRR